MIVVKRHEQKLRDANELDIKKIRSYMMVQGLL